MNITYAHYKITHGPLFAICQVWDQELQKALASIEALIQKHGAKPHYSLRCGPSVVALCFQTSPGRGWRQDRQQRSYFKPDKRTPEGRSIYNEMKKISIPTEEDLAESLGCRTFFKQGAQLFCTAAGLEKKGDIFYIECPSGAAIPKTPGCESIDRGTYYLAVDEKNPS